MSAPMTHDPLVVNTRDGAVWQRRAVTRDGHGLYAVTGSCNCPEYLMATLAELAEHGIAGSADVLPVPVGPEPCALDLDAIVSRALRVSRQYVMPDGADQDDLDRLTDFDVPELVAEVRGLRIELSTAREEIANHQPVLAALDGARSRVEELEHSPLAWADHLDAKSLDNFLICLAQATEHEPMSGVIDEIHQLVRAYREHAARLIPAELGGAL